jgi:hypothetical protein
LKKLNPVLIHTHTPLYNINLKKIGFEANPLPLFSNINEANLQTLNRDNKNIYRLGFFSRIRIISSIIEFINELNRQLKDSGLNLEILLIGGNVRKMVVFKNKIEILCPDVFNISCTGFLDDKKISECLQSCDLGITPVPQHVLGKSGSIAAFLTHNVPVAAPEICEDYKSLGVGFFDKEIQKSILEKPDLNQIKTVTKLLQRLTSRLSLENISNKFISDLSKNIKE